MNIFKRRLKVEIIEEKIDYKKIEEKVNNLIPKYSIGDIVRFYFINYNGFGERSSQYIGKIILIDINVYGIEYKVDCMNIPEKQILKKIK